MIQKTILSFIIVCIFSNYCFSQDKPLKVAVLASLTGPAARQGEATTRGLELAVKDLNKKGVKVELHYQDDRSTANGAVVATKSFLARGFKLFIGPTWSYQIKAIKPILEKNNAITVRPTGSSLIGGGPSKSVFNLAPRRDEQIPIISEWIKKKGFKKVVILTATGDWSEIHREVFIKASKASGATVVSDERYDYEFDQISLQSLFLKLQKKDFDLLLTTGISKNMSDIIKVRNRIKLDFDILGTVHIFDAINEGLIKNLEIEDDVHVVFLPVSSKFNKLHKEVYKKQSDSYSDRAYDAVQILANAYTKVGDNPEKVRDYLFNKLKFKGISTDIEFNAYGDIEQSGYKIGLATDGLFATN